MSPQELFQQTLKRNRFSVTKARSLVFEALEHEEPLTMAEIHAKLHSTIDRATLYRTIDIFEKIGIVQRLQIGWKYKLELADNFSFHHHHLTCTECGLTLPMRDDITLEAAIRNLAMEYGFSEIQHQLEIRGRCPKCRIA